jgi:uncharacterized protein YecE (DUF72 family)
MERAHWYVRLDGHWDGVLYPPGLLARDRLAVYASTFQTVELNASFYRWPPDRTFGGCVDVSPTAS